MGNGAQSGYSLLGGSTGATVGSGGGAVVVGGGGVVVSGGTVVAGRAVVVSGGIVVVGGGEVVVISVVGGIWSDDVITGTEVLEMTSAVDVALNPGGKPVTMVPVTASAG